MSVLHESTRRENTIRPGVLFRKWVEENAKIEIAQHYFFYASMWVLNFLFCIITRQIKKYHIKGEKFWYSLRISCKGRKAPVSFSSYQLAHDDFSFVFPVILVQLLSK